MRHLCMSNLQPVLSENFLEVSIASVLSAIARFCCPGDENFLPGYNIVRLYRLFQGISQRGGSMKIGKACIIGGSGFVGRYLAHRLSAMGCSVVIPTRRLARTRQNLVLPGVKMVKADVHDAAELEQIVAGMDAVINLAGILRGDFTAVHVELPRKIVAACRRNGIKRLLHMSALNARRDGPSEYLRSKAAGEQEVMESGLTTTIFRPSVIFGEGDAFLALFARLTRFFPVFPLASPGARFQPIFVGDVAHAFSTSLADPATFGQSYDLCGPKIYTLKQLVQYVVQITGHHSMVIGLNDRLSYLQALMMEHMPGKLITRDNYYSMKIDSVCNCGATEKFQAVFGSPLVELEEAAPQYLARIPSGAI